MQLDQVACSHDGEIAVTGSIMVGVTIMDPPTVSIIRVPASQPAADEQYPSTLTNATRAPADTPMDAPTDASPQYVKW